MRFRRGLLKRRREEEAATAAEMLRTTARETSCAWPKSAATDARQQGSAQPMPRHAVPAPRRAWGLCGRRRTAYGAGVGAAARQGDTQPEQPLRPSPPKYSCARGRGKNIVGAAAQNEVKTRAVPARASVRGATASSTRKEIISKQHNLALVICHVHRRKAAGILSEHMLNMLPHDGRLPGIWIVDDGQCTTVAM